MPGRTKLFNDIHSYSCDRGQHLFGMAHPFAMIRHSWNGRSPTGHKKLLIRVCVLFCFLSFHLHRRLRYEVYGPWDHIPPTPQESQEGANISVEGVHEDVEVEDEETQSRIPSLNIFLLLCMGQL